MQANQELDLFNTGYDQRGSDSGLACTIRRILTDMARPDRQKAIDLAKAGHNYYLLECDALDDGSRLPYRPW